MRSTGQYVFRYGDYGEKFYIILAGTVSIHVPMLKEIEIKKNHQFSPHHNKKILTEVGRLSRPNTFGDLALIEYKPRAATIKCVEDCVFALIDKTNYQKIFGRLQRKIIMSTIELFRSIPYFAKWSMGDIQKLSPYFKEVEYKFNHTVCKQGDKADFVYIIKSGEFEITKKISQKLCTKDIFFDVMHDDVVRKPAREFR